MLMTDEYQYDTYFLELFPINTTDLVNGIKETTFNTYLPQYSEEIIELFPKERKRFAYFSGVLDDYDLTSVFLEKKGEKYLVSPHDLSSKEFFAFGRKQKDFKVSFKKIEDLTGEQALKTIPKMMDRFLCTYLRRSLPTGFRWEGSIIYNPENDLLTEKNVCSTSPFLSNVGVFPAVSATISHYHDQTYLHVSPTTRIFSKTCLYDLLNQNEGLLDEAMKFARLDLGKKGRTAEIKEITETTADTKITLRAFGNRNFLEFARDNYPNSHIGNPKAKLAIVVPFGLSNPWIFSTEGMYPSLNFQTLNSLDSKFFKNLLGIIKARSVARLENAKDFVKSIAPISTPYGVVEIDSKPFSLKILADAPFLKNGKIDENNIEKLSEKENGAIFETPSITLRMSGRTGEFCEKTIYPFIDGRAANLNDLMKWSDLAPLEIDPEIKVGIIIDERLEKKWKGRQNDFEEALLHGVKTMRYSYRGFEETFKCRLKIVKEFTVSDFFGDEFDSIVKQISPTCFDCILLVIPRWLETPDSSKQIYIVPKEKIMQKGVPVQVIANDETRVRGSLKDKVRDPFIIFGLALNIAAKPGFRLTAFSKEFAEKIIGNSVVISYNITRIMPKLRYVEQNAPIEKLMGTTVPLVAPLFIMDNRGSRVLHWDFYLPKSEISLFSDFGTSIFEKISNDVENIIIHKDGPFRENELRVLEGFNKPHRRVIPISITQSNPLRMHNALHIGIGKEIQRGAFLKLDADNYEVATTTIQSWEAANWGWPRPIHIQFHESMSNTESIKLLYHIFGLTKMHFGSQRPTRLPVSIHYANLVSRFLRALGDEAPSFHQSFAKVFDEKGRMPLWFL
jgi:hypothetical protein